jgi:hypothetical protein
VANGAFPIAAEADLEALAATQALAHLVAVLDDTTSGFTASTFNAWPEAGIANALRQSVLVRRACLKPFGTAQDIATFAMLAVLDGLSCCHRAAMLLHAARSLRTLDPTSDLGPAAKQLVLGRRRSARAAFAKSEAPLCALLTVPADAPAAAAASVWHAAVVAAASLARMADLIDNDDVEDAVAAEWGALAALLLAKVMGAAVERADSTLTSATLGWVTALLKRGALPAPVLESLGQQTACLLASLRKLSPTQAERTGLSDVLDHCRPAMTTKTVALVASLT